MKISQVTEVIERFAPLAWQESYDNAGLIVGRPDDEVHKALLAVDVTDAVLDEAEREGCDLVITHHPIVFRALKRFNSATPVERCVERAIRRGIALYACHTNLDSAPGGMSWRLAGMLGVGNLRVLRPAQAGCEVGPGVVGELSEAGETLASLRPAQGSCEVGPGVVGELSEAGETLASLRPAQADCEMGPGVVGELPEAGEKVASLHPAQAVCEMGPGVVGELSEAGEKVASLRPAQAGCEVGLGVVGELSEAVETVAFLRRMKELLHLGVVRHSEVAAREVRRVAVCTGSGGDLIEDARRAGAELYITSDLRYHDFMTPGGELTIADIGHYESEFCAIQLIFDILSKNLCTFAVRKSEDSRNPVNYMV